MGLEAEVDEYPPVEDGTRVLLAVDAPRAAACCIIGVGTGRDEKGRLLSTPDYTHYIVQKEQKVK